MEFKFKEVAVLLGTGKKSIRGGTEHLEMWLIKNLWPTPSLRHKND